jgi:hypothetical protein
LTTALNRLVETSLVASRSLGEEAGQTVQEATFSAIASLSRLTGTLRAALLAAPSALDGEVGSIRVWAVDQAGRGREVVEAVGRWRLFSDPNHWQTGYWERAITSLADALQHIPRDEPSRTRAVAEFADQVAQAWKDAGYRFLEIARREKGVDLDPHLDLLVDNVQQLVVRAASTLTEELQARFVAIKAATSQDPDVDLRVALSEAAAEATSRVVTDLKNAVAEQLNRIEELQREIRRAQYEEQQELLTELRNYVTHFIDEGQDI